MIIFDLSCAYDHQFEGWFQSRNDLDQQMDGGLLQCPICDNHDIRTRPAMARVNRSSAGDDAADTDITARTSSSGTNTGFVTNYAASQEFVRKLHDYIDSNFIDVGTRFAEEARKIHTGDSDEVGIRGIASNKQVRELNEEGISTLPLPPKPIDKNRLN